MRALTLYPYRIGHTWVFDDVPTGLKAEAFVLGSSEVLTRLIEAKNIPDAGNGFTLRFAVEPFEGFDAELKWLRSDDAQVVPGQDGSASQVAGNWYGGVVAGEEMTGWLCPACSTSPHLCRRGLAAAGCRSDLARQRRRSSSPPIRLGSRMTSWIVSMTSAASESGTGSSQT